MHEIPLCCRVLSARRAFETQPTFQFLIAEKGKLGIQFFATWLMSPPAGVLQL